MTWATPKTNWKTDDVIGTTDMNRWEENIRILSGGLAPGKGADLVVSNGAPLVVTHQIHFVDGSGSAAPSSISAPVGVAAGAILTLINDQSPSWLLLTTGNIKLGVDASYNCSTAGATSTFRYDGTNWYLIGTTELTDS